MNCPQPSSKPNTTIPAASNRGFALVIALGLMAFVLILLLAITTLVQVETQSSSISKSQIEAEQAALLAMQMAIGELQAYTGLDTRVTASSTLLDELNVPVTGVWRSWEGSDRDSDGKPTIPNYAAKRAEGDLDAANPEVGLDVSSSAGRFLGWLSSAELPDDPSDPIPAGVLSNVSGGGRVPMVTSGRPGEDEGSVAKTSEEVYILPTYLREGGAVSGSIAWWVSGDNSKAMINDDSSEEPATVQDWQQRVRSNGWADPAAFEFGDDDIFNNKVLPSTGSLAMVADASAELRHFHDLTTFNRGLLTNTAVGGWRRDLSLMTESYDGDTSDGDPANYTTTSPLPSGARAAREGFSFYTPSPGESGYARKATETDKGPGALLYPWATYRDNPNPWGHTGPVGSWTALVDYANLYKNLDAFSAANTKFPRSSGVVDWPTWETDNLLWADKIRVSPIVARVHWIFSLASESESVRVGRDLVTTYEPRLLLTPVVTIWNPYNVEMEIPGNLALNMQWRDQDITPFRFKFRIGNTPLYQPQPEPRLEGVTFADIAPGGGYVQLQLPTNEPMILPPGASKVFSSASGIVSVDANGSNTPPLLLVSGYNAEGGFLFEIQDFSSGSPQPAQTADSSALFTVEGVNVTGGQDDTIGVYINTLAGGVRRYPVRNSYIETEMGGAAVVDEIYPALGESGDLYSDQISAFDVDGGLTHPFAAAILASRATSPLAAFDEPNYAHLATKGMVQSNPLTCYVEMRTNYQKAHGSLHPINSTYAYSFRELLGWSGSDFGWIPEVAPDGSGYIVSGISSTDGLTRCIMAELPTRPIQSLADLQHWDARNNCSVPPFAFNLIANASATPLIPADDVSFLGPNTLNANMANDDSYLLNHVLFDDWFVSSLAPDYGNFGVTEDRSIGEVYEQHLTGEKPLPNRFYLPASGANLPTVSAAVASVVSGQKDTATQKYGFETVASKFEVAGMFNVNSTSLDAWRALLRHSRDVEVPYLDSSGNTQTDEPRSFTYPRTSIASDQGSDSGTTESGIMAAEFAGHRVLTEAQVDRLANNIVAIIRERGPFLSLSEFVNRELTTNVDRALAGTIQSALDELANLGNTSDNPFRELQANSVAITTLPPGNHEYQFPDAAYGHSAFGMPGWIRQADILRPLAPVLSARDDTFTIRSYGDVRDPTNPDKIVARVWCEAVVVRTADFVDPTEDASVLPHSSDMVSIANQRFGRKYKIASFRWLNEEEI
ncbi:MAG: hypothetical protein ACSHX4_11075 [Opitutaceae bacterium]